MDKQQISKLVLTSNLSVSTISSVVGRSEKDKILQEFVANVNRVQGVEIIIVFIKREK